MKKFLIFLIIVLASICTISYTYLIYKAKYNTVKYQNSTFQKYYQKEIYGADLATVINKAIDSNIKNDVEKDSKSLFVGNDINSIKINIKMTDNDTIYPMEKIASSGIEKFVEYYNKIKFKCTNIEYHTKTNMIKSMLFEQITS